MEIEVVCMGDGGGSKVEKEVVSSLPLGSVEDADGTVCMEVEMKVLVCGSVDVVGDDGPVDLSM